MGTADCRVFLWFLSIACASWQEADEKFSRYCKCLDVILSLNLFGLDFGFSCHRVFHHKLLISFDWKTKQQQHEQDENGWILIWGNDKVYMGHRKSAFNPLYDMYMCYIYRIRAFDHFWSNLSQWWSNRIMWSNSQWWCTCHDHCRYHTFYFVYCHSCILL